MQDIHHHSLGGSGGGGAAGRFFGGGLGGGGGGGDRRMRAVHHHNHQSNNLHHQALKCPRCDSLNTKFCYYNNYNLSQPRHFCKTCRRYWTKGGVLRNVPVGGGCRKAKRAKSKQSSSSSAVGKSSRGGGSTDAGGGKSSASHSSSESSSVTASNSTPAVASAAAATATTAVASEVASAPVSGFLNGSGFDNPKLYGNGIEWSALLGQGSSDGGIFAEMGSFTSLAATSSNETTPFGGFGGNSVNQQWLDQGLKVEGGGLLDDQTAVQVDFPARSLDQNVGFGPVDWGGPGGDQALFDLTSTVDHAYWSQSQWTTDQDHGGLYLL